MTDAVDVPGDGTELSAAEWAAEIERLPLPVPFTRLPWLRWGLAQSPGLRFTPVAMTGDHGGHLLVPLCERGGQAQLGCFGYGSVVTTAPTLPDFAALCGRICATRGLTRLSTLLPPVGVVPAIDRLTGRWPVTPGRTTFVLDLASGSDPVWAAARGSARTAVRRAFSHGLCAGPARPDDGDLMSALYRDTLRRNGVTGGAPVGFLAEAPAGEVVSSVVRDGAGLCAASAFAVAGRTAFHVLQATSATGRRTNAGHLAFWAALCDLAAIGVDVVDLGTAAGAGQEAFKRNWGGRPSATRVVLATGGVS